MKNCLGVWGFLFGHKFKGFYSEKREPGKVNIDNGSRQSACEIIKANTSVTITFEKTQCIRCGATP